MSTKQSRAKAELDLSGGDDFQIINGIGPGIERRLHGANIRSYAQLAALSIDELAGLLSNIGGMSRERIIRQDWIGQARELAMEHGLAPQTEDELEQEAAQALGDHAATYRTPYANFTVELLLDDDQHVRRTRVTQVQAGQEDSWAAWDAGQLVEFFARYADLGLPTDERLASQVEDGDRSGELSEVANARPLRPSAPAESTGVLEMRDLITAPLDDGTGRSPRPDEPFFTTLTLELANTNLPRKRPLEYSATLVAKKLGGRQRVTLGEAHGFIQPAQNAQIRVECAGLARGFYRLELVATVKQPDGAANPAGRLSALFEGGLLQIL